MIVGSVLGRPPKNEIRPWRAAIAMACSWVMLAGVAVMITSAPRPSVSSMTSLDDVDLRGVDDVVGLDRVGRHLQPLGVDVDEARPVPTLCTPRAMRMCMQPIGPAPKTTVKSPSSMPSCSWALMAQANGSAADASS